MAECTAWLQAWLPAQARTSDFSSRFEAAAAELPDIDEVVARNQRTAFPECIAGYIYASEVGPHIAYHLALYPAYAKSLIGLSVEGALLAIDSYAKILSTIYVRNAISDRSRQEAFARLAALRPREIVRLVAVPKEPRN